MSARKTALSIAEVCADIIDEGFGVDLMAECREKLAGQVPAEFIEDGVPQLLIHAAARASVALMLPGQNDRTLRLVGAFIEDAGEFVTAEFQAARKAGRL